MKDYSQKISAIKEQIERNNQKIYKIEKCNRELVAKLNYYEARVEALTSQETGLSTQYSEATQAAETVTAF